LELSQSRLGARDDDALARSAEPSLVGKRVLLAEDDAGTRWIMAKALRSMGLDVVETPDGGRMLVAVTAHYRDGRSPEDLDLVVTDVNMPVVGGLDVFMAMRAARWKTPIIVVTGHATPEVRRSVDRLGAVLLVKPLDLAVFEATVRTLLGVPAPPPSQPSPSNPSVREVSQ